ncbi:MAG: glycosyltransferase family 4 protein, partial [Chloroflexota bacterium]|nr:glycosyltransferase family 4 protein [Chloroflexota bacterium]
REPGEGSNENLHDIRIFKMPLRRNRSGVGYLLGYPAFFLLAAIFLSYRFVFKCDYDLIHVHNMPDFLVFSAILPKILGKNILLDVHDPMPELFSTIFGKRANRFLLSLIRWQSRLSYRFADHVITVHNGMRELLIERGVSPDRIDVIHNFPDASVFGGSKAKPLSRKSMTITYAGTVSQRHGLDVAIQALKLLNDQMPDIQLKIVGDGPDIPQLKGIAEEYGLSDQVVFTGVVPLEQVPQILASSDASVAPYADDPYGALVFPTKVMESFMVGLPVICSRTPTVMRYMGEDSLFLFDLGDPTSLAEQIKLIRTEEDLVAKKLKNAQAFLDRMNWETEKEKLFQIVKNWTHS